MGKGTSDRRGSGPIWFVALAVVIFALYSVTVALSTADDCRGLDKTWQVFPPEWECQARPGFG